MYAGVSFIASVSFACVSHRHHDVREMATEQQPRSTRVSSWSMCVLQCVCQSSSIHVCSHGACRCMGVSFIERKASDKRATAAAKATEPQPRGCQELGEGQEVGGRPTAQHVSTHRHEHKHTHTHVAIPFVVVPCAASPHVIGGCVLGRHLAEGWAVSLVALGHGSQPPHRFMSRTGSAVPWAAASSFHGQRSVVRGAGREGAR